MQIQSTKNLGHQLDMNRGGVHSSTGNSSGLSVGTGSMITDGNSAPSGIPRMQRSASINTDSCLRVPASPLSFSSNNISASSVLDGGSFMQQSLCQDHMQKQGVSSATSLPLLQDPDNMLQSLKKPQFDIRQDDHLQPLVDQQLLENPENSQLPRYQNPQMQALIQQNWLQQRHQQQQILQSLSPMQRVHIQQQQLQKQQQHLRQQFHPQNLHQGPYIKRPFDNGICARRLMQYMYHQRHRPPDNSIHYWRKFVAEYFAPRAKKKLCLSSYENVGNHTSGVFPQPAVDAWHCDICGSMSGKGFETTFEVIPRLSKIKFDSGILDELLFLEKPHECRLASGIMLLEYAKVTEESIYDHMRVVREGQLRIIFTPDLKILSWEFCARHHEELLARRSVAPQVNQLMQVAHKYQNAINESASSGVSSQDLQGNCNMFVSAGRQLARNLELQSLNDLGFSKRFIRCLQISEVLNIMKDLIDFSREHKNGPVESLKIFPRHVGTKIRKQKTHEMERFMKGQWFPSEQTTLDKPPAITPRPNNRLNRVQSGSSPLNDPSSQGSKASLNNYHVLMRQNSTNSSPSVLQHDTVSVMSQAQSQGSVPQIPASLTKKLSANSFSANQQQPLNANIPQQNNSITSQVDQFLPQHVVQQLLQEMMNNRGMVQQSINGPKMKPTANGKESFSGGVVYSARDSTIQSSAIPLGNNIQFANGLSLPNNTDGFKSTPNNTGIMPNNNSSQMKHEIPGNIQLNQEAIENFHIPDLVQGISDFAEWDFQ